MRRLTVPLVVASLLVASSACTKKDAEPDGSTNVEKKAPPKDEFTVVDEKVGAGPEVKEGSRVKVHYTGKLKNGETFDSSVGREPFEVTVGKGEVIKGWDKGLVGMKQGGKRKLTIPHDLGYGEQGSPPKIPPRATLLFDIELLEVK